MKWLYRIYQLCIALPLGLLATVIAAVVTIVGCSLGGSRFWGYYPGRLWARCIIRLLLLPVHVEGKENIERKQSYIFVANHQGAFDIFLIYGFLGRNFKWMMKQSLRKLPFIGAACAAARHIFIDRTSKESIHRSHEAARSRLTDGMSLVVFPEGSRTRDGRLQPFKRGAFVLADELKLPVVPLTIKGAFKVMPRQRDGRWVTWSPLTLIIKEPIQPLKDTDGKENVRQLMQQCHEVIEKTLNEN